MNAILITVSDKKVKNQKPVLGVLFKGIAGMVAPLRLSQHEEQLVLYGRRCELSMRQISAVR